MIMNMKSGLVFAALALVAAGCGKNIEYDACGQVDATQVTVSAENAGRVRMSPENAGRVRIPPENAGHVQISPGADAHPSTHL